MTLSSQRGTEMCAEEVTSHTFPEELVEKIVAMMPYPSIFKARLLSKAWFARFRPISFLDTEVEKCVATSFQKMVAEWSINWDTFCPICTTVQKPGKDSIVYNQATQNWHTLPPLSFPKYNMFPTWLRLPPTFSRCVHDQDYEGAFSYGSAWFKEEEHMYVGNILTREWKLLPVRAEKNYTNIRYMKLVIDTSLQSYKVILFCETYHPDLEDYRCCVQMYDSRSETWRSKVYFNHQVLSYASDCVLLNGVLYLVANEDLRCLLAFHVDEWTLEDLRLSFTDAERMHSPKLVICNGNLVIIVIERPLNIVSVLKVDLVSRRVSEVARCPATFELDVVDMRDMSKAGVSEADCVFLKMSYFGCQPGSRLIKYNKHNDEWSFFSLLRGGYHWRNCIFQPGLNPFMAV